MIRNLSNLVALIASLVALAAGAFPTAAHATLPDTVVIDVVGGGRAVATPDRVCDSQCNFTYGEASTAIVNVAADPDDGWRFSHWAPYGPGSNSTYMCVGSTTPVCQVNFANHGTFTHAYFKPVFVPDVQLASAELSVSTTSGGKVTGPGIDCPGDCTQNFSTFPLKQVATLSAEPAPGYSFSGWEGACSGTMPSCVVFMSEHRSVSASFVPSLSSATLSVAVSGGGSVTGQGIACPGDCNQAYVKQPGQPHPIVTLTAAPNAGFKVVWHGDCAGSQSCVLSMSQDRSVQASFVPSVSGGPGQPGQPGTPPPGQPGQPGQPGNPGGPGTPPHGGPIAEETCTVKGTRGADVLLGTPGRDVICGLGGNDRLVGRGGDDILVGGAGADGLEGGRGDDLLYGGAGRDRLVGGAGRDRLDAGTGNDRVVGGRGFDRLLGGKGADLLLARDGSRDRLDGGRGRDRGSLDRLDIGRRIEKRA